MPSVLPSWRAETIVCLASGPTLTAEDCARVKASGLPAIAVNDAIRLAPWAPVLYSSDRGWWSFYHGMPGYLGLRVSVGMKAGDASPMDRFPSIVVLRHTGIEGFERDPGGLRTGGNSGYAAVNLAAHFGARKILLVGYHGGTFGGRSHFFGRHPSGLAESSEANYLSFRRAFETLAPELAAAGIAVLNCTPDTKLQAFRIGTLAEELARETVARAAEPAAEERFAC